MVLKQKNFLWMQFSIMILLLVFSYWEPIQNMAEQWIHNDDFSHGLLIIPISVFLVWEKRKLLTLDRMGTDWRALPLLFAAIAIYAIGELGAELFTVRMSLIIFFIGALWLLFGLHLIKTLRFPLIFLFLMLPLPGLVYRNLTFPLQIISSKWSVAFLNMIGVLAYREGNVIDLGFSQLQVVEACNGLRFILPLFTIGVLFAFWKKKSLWKRISLISITIPIAILANIFRISGTGVLSNYFGKDAAEGFFHSFSGWVVFMASFLIFFAFNKLIDLIPNFKEKSKVKNIANIESSQNRITVKLRNTPFNRYGPIAMIMFMIAATPFLVNVAGNVAPQKLKQPLGNFPLVLDDRVGQGQTMDAEMWDKVGGQDYFLANYENQEAAPINAYVAYYEYQRKGGDFIHSPRLCLPGAGWFISLNHERRIEDLDKKRLSGVLKFNELLVRKGEDARLVYFWYQGRNRNFTSEWAAKFYMVWDGIWKRRTDGALVRLVMPLSPGEQLDSARTTMDTFAIAVFKILDQNFLPK